MGSDRPTASPFSEIGWTLPQRRALLFLLVLMFCWLAFRFATDRQDVPDPQPAAGARAGELASRLDPNTADWQSLAAIPTLGAKRAKEIVAYRDRQRGADSASIVFATISDMNHVRGIGPATAKNIEPYLVFPAGVRVSPR